MRRWLVLLAVTLVCPGLGRTSAARAEIYVYRDDKGALHFTNAPSRRGFRRFRSSGASRLWGGVPGRPDPRRYRAFDPLIEDAAARYGVEPALIKAVIHAESDFIPYARSPKGALGLMQLMPATARAYQVAAVFDPRENIEAGVRHLRDLLDRYDGDVRLALAAYNAGVAAVTRYDGVPPYPETRQYIDRVLRYRQRYLREP